MKAPSCCGYPMIWDGQSGSSDGRTATTTIYWRCSICGHTATTTPA